MSSKKQGRAARVPRSKPAARAKYDVVDRKDQPLMFRYWVTMQRPDETAFWIAVTFLREHADNIVAALSRTARKPRRKPKAAAKRAPKKSSRRTPTGGRDADA